MANKIKIQFPDGSKKSFDKGVKAIDIAKDISEGLARAVLAAEVNNKLVDMNTKIEENSIINFVKFNSKAGWDTFQHSAAHVLAQAILRLYPKAKLTIGPTIEEGFYYDIDMPPIKQEDLGKIEKEMQKVVDENLAVSRHVVSQKKALEMFKNNKYKVEMIKDLFSNKVTGTQKTKSSVVPKSEKITYYEQGEFKDLCRGPHVSNTGAIKSFKLLQTSSAYWRGDAKKESLQRIYGVAFPDKKELKKHLFMLQEAKKRDHNKLGRELEYFTTSEVVGKGLPLLMPKGAIVKRILQRFIEDEEEKRGYVPTITPVLTKSDLYKISGHLDHYRESMFVFETNGEEMCLRPMTCPHQFMIYKFKKRSYRELPIRYSEVSELFRNETSGELHGLIRVRQFTLSDAHIICRPDQLEKEFEDVLHLVEYVMDCLGIKEQVWYRFSKGDLSKPDKYIDNPKAWKQSEATLKKIIDKLGVKYVEEEDEAAFYGPKLDVQMKNVYGKEDTLFTIQIDFALPEKFDMTYTDEKSNSVRPMIIHRASIGCLERTMALLIEHYAGKMPLWVSPIQARILTVSEKFTKYGQEVKDKMRAAGLRVELDDRTESIGKKIRDAQLEKINYMLVVGEREVKDKTVTARNFFNKVLGAKKVDSFIKDLVKEVDEKRIPKE